MIDIVGKRLRFFIISGVIITISIVALANFGLKPGIEFSSGSMMTINFEQEVESSDLKQELIGMGYTDAIIQQTGEGDFLIRTTEITSEAKAELTDALTTKFGPATESEFHSVSPMVASETARNAGIAIGVAAVGILLYITLAFRKMPKPFRYGTCAIIALGHDTLIAMGIFAILGATWGWQIDLKFIIGILAVVGYSVNNTVVVFDRIRENLSRGISPDFKVVVNTSLIETLGRSLNTSLTTLFVILALLLFVGASIQNFAVVMLIGIVAGTFSSIFIAPNILVAWEKRARGKLSRPAKVPQSSQ